MRADRFDIVFPDGTSKTCVVEDGGTDSRFVVVVEGGDGEQRRYAVVESSVIEIEAEDGVSKTLAEISKETGFSIDEIITYIVGEKLVREAYNRIKGRRQQR